MTTFKEIQGRNIRAVSTDPANPGEGEMWYNKTIGVLKGVSKIGAWSSGGNLSTGRYIASALGTQTAAVITGGSTPSFTNAVEEYNGTGFTTATNYPINITNSGRAGTQTAGLVAGGNAPPFITTANEYDGSSWTATGSLPTAADNIGSCGTGTQSNVIMTLGRIPSTINAGNDTTATYNGSTFSAGPNINTARLFGQSSAGTGTAGLIYGGFIDPAPNAMTNTEEYNGTAWTAANALNRASGLNTGWGTQTSAIAQVNAPGYKGAEQYDGTSWTNISDMTLADNGANYSTAAGATADAGFITSRGPAKSATEEYNFGVNVIIPAAWSSGGNMNTSRSYASSTSQGTQDATVVFGGYTVPNGQLNNSESYNGSTWTATPTLNTGRRMLGGAGTQTAGLAFGGFRDAPAGPPTLHQNITESWNGSTWTTLPATMPVAQNLFASFGSQTAAVAAAGTQPAPTGNVTQLWNGSAWTTSPGTVNTARFNLSGSGSQTSGLIFGGSSPPAGPPYTPSSSSESWNGTAWTSTPSLNTARQGVAGAGNQTATLAFGGVPPNSSEVEGYDGTSWSTRPSLGTARYTAVGSGTQTAALASGGGTPSVTNATEEFTGETTALNIKTFTTS